MTPPPPHVCVSPPLQEVGFWRRRGLESYPEMLMLLSAVSISRIVFATGLPSPAPKLGHSLSTGCEHIAIKASIVYRIRQAEQVARFLFIFFFSSILILSILFQISDWLMLCRKPRVLMSNWTPLVHPPNSRPKGHWSKPKCFDFNHPCSNRCCCCCC